MRRDLWNKRFVVFAAAAILGLASTVALTACNTTEGVGKDIEAAGDAIADTAHDAKN